VFKSILETNNIHNYIDTEIIWTNHIFETFCLNHSIYTETKVKNFFIGRCMACSKPCVQYIDNGKELFHWYKHDLF